jgi:hypothetical protein
VRRAVLVRIKATVKEVEGLSLTGGSPGFVERPAETLDLARPLDYDEAAEKAWGLAAELK